MQICLEYARQEYRMDRTECGCGGTLWAPRNVGGQVGNTYIDGAARLILAGKDPWRKP